MPPRRKPLAPPDLKELLNRRKRETKLEINCVLLGTVKKFYSADQTADISINYKKVISGGLAVGENQETDKYIDYPLLVKCPVVVLSGGLARLTMPIAAGDTCLVMFCDREISTWFKTGQVNYPRSDRVHDLTDGIALVGIRSLSNAISSFNTTIASLIDLHGERLAQSGDMKFSARTANHSGWLIMNGATIGKSSGTYQGEMYRDLFNILKAWSPNAGTENFDGGSTVVIPDMRGRVPVGADNMGGSAANVLTNTYTPNRNTLGGAIGEEAHQLTVPELARHRHGFYAWGSQSSTGPISLNDRCPWSQHYTEYEGNDVPHNNVQPGRIGYYFIKI